MKNKLKKCVICLLLIGFGVLIGSLSSKKETALEEKTFVKKDVNILSMMLETEAGSGNYELTTRSEWPTDGYIFNSELSRCENGGELSWDDENKRILMSGNMSDKCYVYFDKALTLSDYVKSQYTGTQGENSIYYHNDTLTNGAGDNSYRYAGASSAVNNYICLGSSESICPDANLFRIIGVFGNQVKVIRAKSVGKMAWNNNGSNTWSSASLNTYLKETYLPSLGTLADKIATTTWKVGGNVWDNIGLQTAKVAYENEVGSNSLALTFVAKIGLIYVSDYMYAVPKDKWTLVGNNYSEVVSVNWIYLYDDSPGWFITPNTFNTSYAYSVFFQDGLGSNGNIMGGFSSDTSFVHPAFYLLSSVTYKSGTGSSASDPIRIN